MRRSKLLLLANILASFFLIMLISYLYFAIVWSNFSEEMFSAHSKGIVSTVVFMVPGAVILLSGIVMQWTAFLKKTVQLVKIANIFCTIGAVMTLAFCIYFVPSVVLWWIVFAIEKNNS